MSARRMEPRLLALAATFLLMPAAQAATGKLVLTGGITSVEGTAGGGITPWAMIGTQATENEWGVSASSSFTETNDYRLNTFGIAAAWNERVEFSLAQQRLDTGITGTALTGSDLVLEQQIIGAKVRVFGEAVLDADTWMPQVSVGVQHKRLDANALEPTLQSLGARRSGTDVYVSATKLFLAPGILVNTTLRATNANQNGLLGFGARLGGDESRHQIVPEVSVAKLLRNNLAVGMEYRVMPNKLARAGQAAGLGNGLAADDWKDVFIAWAPHKQVSLTAAYVDLGRIVPATTNNRDQRGIFVSAQIAF